MIGPLPPLPKATAIQKLATEYEAHMNKILAVANVIRDLPDGALDRWTDDSSTNLINAAIDLQRSLHDLHDRIKRIETERSNQP